MAVRKPRPTLETHPGAEAFLPVKHSLKPTRYEIAACRPWLDAELEVVEPDIIVLLGATAAQALLGNQFRVTKSRGIAIESELARFTFATVHPASVLRAPDEESRRQAREDFFSDVAIVGDHFRRR